MRYSNRISELIQADDERKINSERIFLSRKIEEIQNSILQLENNIMFITGATDKNPLVAEVNKNIEKHKQELQVWKDKLSQLNQAIQKSKQTVEENTSDNSNSETEEKENEA